MNEYLLADALLLRQLIDLEQQYLNHTAKVLAEELRQRFGHKRQALVQKHSKGFAALYADAMTTSYLYGAYHVQKLLKTNEPLELAGTPFDVSFGEAQDYLKAQITINKTQFSQLEANLKFRAFTIARVGQEDVINRVKHVYQEHLKSGNGRNQVLNNIDTILEQAGVSENNPGWLHTHYRNNMMAAYNGGRWAQVEQLDIIEFLIYNSIVDGHTTELCKGLHKTVKPKRDRFWQKFHPGNHHGCRGILTPATRAMLERMGIKVSDIKAADIYENETAKKEHQFKAHPGAALKSIPASLAMRSIQYEVGPDILKYAASSNKAYFEKRLASLGKSKLSKKAIEHGLERHPNMYGLLDKAEQALQSPDEVWLSLSPRKDGGYDAALVNILWLDKETLSGVVVGARAFDGSAHTFYTINQSDYERLKKYGAQRLK